MVEPGTDQGVTVVVPTLNRGRYLLDTVVDLLNQEHRPIEILIVDQSDMVDPHLSALVAQHPDFISHYQVNFRGLPIARNFGWQQARYDTIVFVDDDIRCEPDFVSQYHNLLSTGEIELCGGGIDGEDAGGSGDVGFYNYWLATPSVSFASPAVRDVDHVKGCNFAVRRHLLAQLGGFDELLNQGAALHEETELMLRAREQGIRIRYDGSIRVTHLAAQGGGTRQRDIGQYVHALAHNRSILIRRHSRWYQYPSAVAYSLKLATAYALHYRRPEACILGIRGVVKGWRSGEAPPACTAFRTDEPT